MAHGGPHSYRSRARLLAPDADALPSRQARLRDAFPAGFSTERSAFEALLAKVGPAPPLPPAVQQLCVDAGSGARVLHAPLTDPVVLDWHKRVAPFVLFFIDAGSNIDAECAPPATRMPSPPFLTRRAR